MTALPEGFVRWPGPIDEWATKSRTVPDGFRLAIVDEMRRRQGLGWRRLAKPRLCRFTIGPGHASCRRPAVLELMRGTSRSGQPWGYCERHLYGRRWECGRLLTAILVSAEL